MFLYHTGKRSFPCEHVSSVFVILTHIKYWQG